MKKRVTFNVKLTKKKNNLLKKLNKKYLKEHEELKKLAKITGKYEDQERYNDSMYTDYTRVKLDDDRLGGGF